MKNFKRASLIAVLLILAGCQTSTVVTTLEAVVSATQAVVNLLPGIPPAIKAEVTTSLTSVTAFVVCISPELQSNDPFAVQAAKYLACAQQIQWPGSSEARAIVAAVEAAVAAFLAPFQPQAAHALNAVKVKLPLSAADKAKVQAIQNKNAALAAALR
jgi:hypothetical protein